MVRMNTEMLDKFIEFAKAKPADEDYEPGSPMTCALAQFAMSIDPGFARCEYAFWTSKSYGKITQTRLYSSPDLTVNGWKTEQLDRRFRMVIRGSDNYGYHGRWGQLVERLEKFRAELIAWSLQHGSVRNVENIEG